MSLLRNGLFYLFLLSAFFPYIQFFPLDTDIQPNTVIISIAIFAIFFSIIRPPPQEIWFFLLPLLIALIIAFSNLNFQSIRGFFSSYVSIFFITYSSYIVFLFIGLKNFLSFFKAAVLIWLLIGLLQTFIDPFIATEFLGRSTGSLDQERGVVGLATEPSYYAFSCLLMIFFAVELKNRLLFLVLIFQILFLAKSAIVLMILFYIFVIYQITHLSIKSFPMKLITLFTGFLLLYYGLFETSFQEQSRFVSVFRELLHNPTAFFEEDESANARLYGIIESFSLFYDNYFMPSGYGKRFMSGYGTVFFELGIFAIFIPVGISIILYRYCMRNKRKAWTYIICVNTIFFAALPLSTPLIGVILGFMLQQIQHRRVEYLSKYCGLNEKL